MSLTLITARRVIAEVLRDRRTVALVLLVPSFMLWLMYLIYDGNRRLFDSIAVLMLGVFPMLMMFIIASVSMQRERSNGTLERLWTTRLSRIQFLTAYGFSFSFFALLQSTLLVGVAHWLLDVTTAAPLGWVFLVSPLSGIVGGSLGLMTSTFASNEFQAVQFMPVVIVPQFLLSGVLVPRDTMLRGLEIVSNVLPLSYVIDALQELAAQPELGDNYWKDVAILVLFIVGILVTAALSIPRQTT